MIDHVYLLRYFRIPLEAAVIDSVISNILLLLACLLVLNTFRYYLPTGRQYLNIFSICLFLTILWMLLIRWLLNLTAGNNDEYRELLNHSISIRFSIAFLIIGCVTLISILWYTQQEQKEKDERKTDAENLAREAELFKLRQQLQPHFLFNSLNSINALIGSRPDEARKMVQQLSDFLRGTIKKEETQWVTLQEELEYLQLYLDIEKVRFGNRLDTSIEIQEDVLKLKLPALLLQPIVENAIKFGLYDTVGKTTITLQATQEENYLIITVKNPFDPETSSPKPGTGFGLNSIKRRLSLLFARTDLLITETKNNIFITVVKIPQAENEQSNNHR
jgi:LytS/YehU family sensor histidine kinase